VDWEKTWAHCIIVGISGVDADASHNASIIGFDDTESISKVPLIKHW
jgi:hypothetical protein